MGPGRRYELVLWGSLWWRRVVVIYLLPGKALPEGEADGYGWVEVASGYGSAGDDGKGDA